MKRCTKCGIEKAQECFNKNRSMKDGLSFWCRVCIKAKDAAWYATPEGKAKAKTSVDAYLATPEGKAKHKAAQDAYYATPEGKAKTKAAITSYYATPEGKAKKKANTIKRRARKSNAPGPHHTAKQWVDKRAEYDQRCAYCFRKPKRLTLDHVVPLIRGGSNAIENCVPACATCNSSKGAKDLRVWLGIVIESKSQNGLWFSASVPPH